MPNPYKLCFTNAVSGYNVNIKPKAKPKMAAIKICVFKFISALFFSVGNPFANMT
jgi:hypothetical protein